MPEIEKIFPQAVKRLISFALQAQEEQRKKMLKENKENCELDSERESDVNLGAFPCEALFQAAGLRVRRPHFEWMIEKWVVNKNGYGEIHLPGGWRLACEKVVHPENEKIPTDRRRWILEQI
jgi:hypothetical protein